jgi:photosystem II stability/assembly factor-like uncharacterized protein
MGRLWSLLAYGLVACSQPAPGSGPSDADGLDTGGGPDAGGGNWSVQRPAGQASFWAVGAAGTDLYVVGSGGTVLQSSDSGATWSSVGVAATDPPTNHYPTLRGFAATAADDVWIAGMSATVGQSQTGGLLLHSADRGGTWQTVDVGNTTGLDGVWAFDRLSVLVSTYDGQILKTADGGAHWTVAFADAQMVLYQLWAAAGAVYAAGGRWAAGADAGTSTTAMLTGEILRSSDAGDSWQTVVTGAPGQFWSVWGTPDGTSVTAVGNSGAIASTNDHGASWTTSGAPASGSDFQISGVWVSPRGTTYFLPSGRRFPSDPTTSGNQRICASVSVSEEGAGGMILTSTGGCQILPPENGASATANSVWGTTDDDIWVVGAYGFIWHGP